MLSGRGEKERIRCDERLSQAARSLAHCLLYVVFSFLGRKRRRRRSGRVEERSWEANGVAVRRNTYSYVSVSISSLKLCQSLLPLRTEIWCSSVRMKGESKMFSCSELCSFCRWILEICGKEKHARCCRYVVKPPWNYTQSIEPFLVCIVASTAHNKKENKKLFAMHLVM